MTWGGNISVSGWGSNWIKRGEVISPARKTDLGAIQVGVRKGQEAWCPTTGEYFHEKGASKWRGRIETKKRVGIEVRQEMIDLDERPVRSVRN